MKYSKLLKILLAPFMLYVGEETGGGGGTDAGAGSGGFDMASAVSDIGAGLGFSSESNDDTTNTDPNAAGAGDDVDPTPRTGDDAAATPSGDAKPETPPADKPAGSDADAGKPADGAGPAGVAPRTWRAEAAAEWDKLPAAVKAEVAKREEDMFRGLEGYKVQASHGKAFVDAIGKHLPTLKAAGADPFALAGEFMDAHVTLATGSPEAKAALIRQMDTQYGLNLAGMFQDPDFAPAVDPQVKHLQDKLARLESQLSGTQSQVRQETERQQQAMLAELSREVDAFSKDPANIYYAEVEHMIPAILASGMVKGLKAAYDHAVMMNPATQAKELSRRTTEAAAKSAAEAKAKAEAAAKAAAANVRTKAKPASAAAPLGSIDDTLNQAYAKLASNS